MFCFSNWPPPIQYRYSSVTTRSVALSVFVTRTSTRSPAGVGLRGARGESDGNTRCGTVGCGCTGASLVELEEPHPSTTIKNVRFMVADPTPNGTVRLGADRVATWFGNGAGSCTACTPTNRRTALANCRSTAAI